MALTKNPGSRGLAAAETACGAAAGGATLSDVCELTERFYTARGSFPKTPVYQRAVELV
ncbi:hypothetical protein LCGC14_3074010, partial [marine sediment metagenome]